MGGGGGVSYFASQKGKGGKEKEEERGFWGRGIIRWMKMGTLNNGDVRIYVYRNEGGREGGCRRSTSTFSGTKKAEGRLLITVSRTTGKKKPDKGKHEKSSRIYLSIYMALYHS